MLVLVIVFLLFALFQVNLNANYTKLAFVDQTKILNSVLKEHLQTLIELKSGLFALEMNLTALTNNTTNVGVPISEELKIE